MSNSKLYLQLMPIQFNMSLQVRHLITLIISNRLDVTIFPSFISINSASNYISSLSMFMFLAKRIMDI